MPATFVLMAVVSLVGVIAALRLWPMKEIPAIPHDHPNLPSDDPHLREHASEPGHSHAIIIDDLHHRWL